MKTILTALSACNANCSIEFFGGKYVDLCKLRIEKNEEKAFYGGLPPEKNFLEIRPRSSSHISKNEKYILAFFTKNKDFPLRKHIL